MAQRRQQKERAKRVPVSGLRDILTVFGKDEEYVYRWVVDKDDNGSVILKYKRGGYELVESGSHEVGEDSVYKARDGSSIVRIPSGGGKFSYLMRILREWYDEDKAAEYARLDEIEATIMQTGTADGETDFGQYGKIDIGKR